MKLINYSKVATDYSQVLSLSLPFTLKSERFHKRTFPNYITNIIVCNENPIVNVNGFQHWPASLCGGPTTPYLEARTILHFNASRAKGSISTMRSVSDAISPENVRQPMTCSHNCSNCEHRQSNSRNYFSTSAFSVTWHFS